MALKIIKDDRLYNHIQEEYEKCLSINSFIHNKMRPTEEATIKKWGNKQQQSYVRQGWVSSKLRAVKKWFSGLFGAKSIEALDLRSDPSRGHGAEYLRFLWPELRNKKLISTRDGKPV